MKKKNYFVLVLFLQSWIFFSVLLTTPIQSENSAPQETNLSVKTSSNDAFSRILNEIQVNYYTTSNQQHPSVCALSSDTLAVAWQSWSQDGNGDGVYANVFDATTGKNITNEFRVNDCTQSHQQYPSICALSSDTFAVAWQSEGQDEAGGYGVYSRVFNATTGKNITREFRVNHYTTDIQQQPSICALSSDMFAVAWESEGQDGSIYGVYARVFNATTGNNITREFRVNHYTQSYQGASSICALSSDRFVVAWRSYGQDGYNDGVYARVFNATTGNNITREFRANYYTSHDQRNPSICALSSDTVAVAWQSWEQDEAGGYGVYSRVFNATTGNNITNEFRANHYTSNNQQYPSICALSSDTVAVAWESEGQDEAGGYGVYASVFGNPSTSQPSGTSSGGGDDDDDDEELNILFLSLIIIGSVLIVGITGIILYIIKKKGR